MLLDLARGRVVPPALDREDEEEALLAGEGHVVPGVAGVPLARELERGDAVLEVALALLEVLRGVDDGVQVGGGPHVLEGKRVNQFEGQFLNHRKGILLSNGLNTSGERQRRQS